MGILDRTRLLEAPEVLHISGACHEVGVDNHVRWETGSAEMGHRAQASQYRQLTQAYHDLATINCDNIVTLFAELMLTSQHIARFGEEHVGPASARVSQLLLE
jgi:hypothetical protein